MSGFGAKVYSNVSHKSSAMNQDRTEQVVKVSEFRDVSRGKFSENSCMNHRTREFIGIKCLAIMLNSSSDIKSRKVKNCNHSRLARVNVKSGIKSWDLKLPGLLY